MPLLPDAAEIIRANLMLLANDERPKVVTIGHFTDSQFNAINELRTKHNLPALGSTEIVFMGTHLYRSRIAKNNYTIDDVLDQIVSAMAHTSTVIVTTKMTALKIEGTRADRYGNQVRDEAIFEMTQRRPKAELFSVIPKGDRNQPPAPVVPVI